MSRLFKYQRVINLLPGGFNVSRQTERERERERGGERERSKYKKL